MHGPDDTSLRPRVRHTNGDSPSRRAVSSRPVSPTPSDATFDDAAWRDALHRLRAGEPVLPAEALRRYAAARDASPVPDDVTTRWRRALVASSMRRRATGGRLAALLVDAGLCALDDLARCVDLHLDAPPAPQTAVAFDLDDTRYVTFARAPLASLTPFAARLASLIGPARHDLNDPSQGALAVRLAHAGDLDGCATALQRILWHGDLARALRNAWPALTDALRAAFAARLWTAVATSALPAVHHVRYFCEIATMTRDPAHLDAAEAAVRALPAHELAVTPDYAHPLEDLADAFASLDRWRDALAIVRDLDPPDRWTALYRLLPRATEPARRAALIADAIEVTESIDLARLLERAPEAWPDVLDCVEAIDDRDERFEVRCELVAHLPHAQARSICADLVDEVARRPPDLARPAGCERMAALLLALTAARCEAALPPSRRAALCDALLAAPAVNLWREALPFVPDDRVGAVLDVASARLARATHYLDRDDAMELGLALLPRLDAPRRAAFLDEAHTFAPRVCWDRLAPESLRAWPDEVMRHIVAERLRIHQREHLDAHALTRWRRLCDDATAYPCEADEAALHEALDTAGDDDAAALRALARTRAIGGIAAVEAVYADAVALLGQP
jgi:hypothetical protein